MKTVKIEILPSGKTQIEVNGAKGQECLDLTKAIEDSLGKVMDRKEKPEMYESVQVSGSIQVGK